METQANKSPHTLFWIAGIAVTVFSLAGIAAIMGWIPNSTGSPSDDAQLTKLDRPSVKMATPAPTRARTAPAPIPAPQNPAQVASNAPASAKVQCAECGVIESIREIATRGASTGLGVVGGAVVGGVLGHQIGSGRGQDIATVAGAVGGAVAGNQIEKSVKSSKSYEITVRFEDGSSRAISETNPPAWRIGDRVKVINGAIQSNA